MEAASLKVTPSRLEFAWKFGEQSTASIQLQASGQDGPGGGLGRVRGFRVHVQRLLKLMGSRQACRCTATTTAAAACRRCSRTLHSIACLAPALSFGCRTPQTRALPSRSRSRRPRDTRWVDGQAAQAWVLCLAPAVATWLRAPMLAPCAPRAPQVKPASGVLQPRASAALVVTMAAQQQRPADLASCSVRPPAPALGGGRCGGGGRRALRGPAAPALRDFWACWSRLHVQHALRARAACSTPPKPRLPPPLPLFRQRRTGSWCRRWLWGRGSRPRRSSSGA